MHLVIEISEYHNSLRLEVKNWYRTEICDIADVNNTTRISFKNTVLKSDLPLNHECTCL